MLQQTQVATVLPYYRRWMERFPTVDSLAATDLDEVLSLWQGLGYYSRCRNLHAAAKRVAKEGFPVSSAGWRQLPGIGAYTAAAIASITLGEPIAAVDGNVERVYARFMASTEPRARLARAASEWSEAVMKDTGAVPSVWNQALMELGAIVCTPKHPNCTRCPLSAECRGIEEPLAYPVRPPTPKPINVEYVVWVPLREGKVGLRRIPPGSWWAGLWEFPREADEQRLLSEAPGATVRPLGEVRHQVTHHRLTMKAYLAEAEEWPIDLDWLHPGEIERRAMPAPQRKIARMALKEMVAANGLEPLT